MKKFLLLSSFAVAITFNPLIVSGGELKLKPTDPRDIKIFGSDNEAGRTVVDIVGLHQINVVGAGNSAKGMIDGVIFQKRDGSIELVGVLRMNDNVRNFSTDLPSSSEMNFLVLGENLRARKIGSHIQYEGDMRVVGDQKTTTHNGITTYRALQSIHGEIKVMDNNQTVNFISFNLPADPVTGRQSHTYTVILKTQFDKPTRINAKSLVDVENQVR